VSLSATCDPVDGSYSSPHPLNVFFSDDIARRSSASGLQTTVICQKQVFIQYTHTAVARLPGVS